MIEVKNKRGTRRKETKDIKVELGNSIHNLYNEGKKSSWRILAGYDKYGEIHGCEKEKALDCSR